MGQLVAEGPDGGAETSRGDRDVWHSRVSV